MNIVGSSYENVGIFSLLEGAGEGAAAILVSDTGLAAEVWLAGLDSGAGGCGATDVFLDSGVAVGGVALELGVPGATVVLEAASLETMLLGLDTGLE